MSHALRDVARFTKVHTGWKDWRGGGRVPVYEKTPVYYRWYCECGSVGGRSSTKAKAVTDHVMHQLGAS